MLWIGVDHEDRKKRNLVFHGLQYTFISLARNAGIPDFAVMRMAGHSFMRMTESYSHFDLKDHDNCKLPLYPLASWQGSFISHWTMIQGSG